MYAPGCVLLSLHRGQTRLMLRNYPKIILNFSVIKLSFSLTSFQRLIKFGVINRSVEQRMGHVYYETVLDEENILYAFF